ncbi:hypothetical protein FAVG1_09655 [Fusarium avenaceum]|nr:hypothetical protein FAVG1_09655 [Fusarium avenaceum]
MDNWHAHLSVGPVDRFANVLPKAVIVGYSGLSGHPVSARSPSDSPIEGPLDMSDSCSGIHFITEPGNEPSGGNVIWHETLTVSDNISAIKRLVVGNNRQFDSEKDLTGKISLSHKRMTEGLPFDPPAHHKPEIEGDSQPDLAHLYHGIGGRDTHFTLDLPCLGIIEIPKELIDRLITFLWKYPHDPMALNDAIQAVLVYHNIDRAKRRKAEIWAYNTIKTKLALRDVVPSVPLGTFIIYWPHYKRFHEVHKMSRYMHPFRFVHSNYDLDCKKFGSCVEIDSSHIDSERVFELVDNIKSLEPDIPANHFIPVLPHSMPGSKLIWPKGTGAAQKGTTALAGLLLLNDINLCGLPSYHHRNKAMQLIAMPACFANTIVRSLVSGYIHAPSIPTQNFWKPDVKPDLVSISGENILVGPFFQNLSPSTNRQDLDNSYDTERFNRQMVQRSRMYLNLAKSLKVPLENITVDPKSGLITWDGMQNEAVISAEQGMPSVVKRAVGMPQDLNKTIAAPAPTQAFRNS